MPSSNILGGDSSRKRSSLVHLSGLVKYLDAFLTEQLMECFRLLAVCNLVLCRVHLILLRIQNIVFDGGLFTNR